MMKNKALGLQYKNTPDGSVLFSDGVQYIPAENWIVCNHDPDPETLKAIHLVKKHFGGVLESFSQTPAESRIFPQTPLCASALPQKSIKKLPLPQSIPKYGRKADYLTRKCACGCIEFALRREKSHFRVNCKGCRTTHGILPPAVARSLCISPLFTMESVEVGEQQSLLSTLGAKL